MTDSIYEVPGESHEVDFDLPDDLSALQDDDYERLAAALGAAMDAESHEQVDDHRRPIVAVVGRPNVGKSTFVNRIIGRREAVVEDTPGVTRDRVRYEAEWNGIPFIVVDTGGWEQDPRGLAVQVSAQAQEAMSTSDVVLFVVDATVGATDADEAIVRILRLSLIHI